MTILKRGSKGSAVKELQRLLKVYPDGIFGEATMEAVIDFQEKNGLTADGVVGFATMKRLLSTMSSLKKSSRKIDEIIVHCTATKEGLDYTVDDVRRWHKNQGWSDIGYHYLVLLNGCVCEGRDVDIAGAHCSGHNTHSIGVCYVGGIDSDGKTAKDTRTPEQRERLLKLLKELREIYPNAKIHGHRDFASKACPSFDATEEYKDI